MLHMENGVLVCGASFAGLATAFWMTRLGYKVTVVEIAFGLKRGGTPVDIEANTIEIVKRMGLFDQIQSKRISMETIELKNSEDVTESTGFGQSGEAQRAAEEYEIERDVLLDIMFAAVENDAEFFFGDSILSLTNKDDGVEACFRSGVRRKFALVFGCDGIHSAVRKLCFGEETNFMHFLGAYFSITIVDKLLIRENTTQLYNEPGKAIMLNAYNGKTDIVLCFSSDLEIPYDYRNEEQQRAMIYDQFDGVGWRTPELLDEVKRSETFYFDKLCQMKMPSWTKGRVALVGDAGYCASPAAGKGGSLAIDGASALYDAFEKCCGNFELAFQDYNTAFRPFIEQVQADAINFGLKFMIPKTAEAIRDRNSQATSR
jgi:2-polyprenyl-6-methoxyphenol hydroxylase-like FAD-dependent oxidoreductase